MCEWVGMPSVETEDAGEGLGLTGRILKSITDIY